MSNNRDGTGRFKPGASGNPNGRPRKQATKQDAIEAAVSAALAQRGDGWANVISGFGQASRDKRLSTTFCADVIDDETAMELWRGNVLGKRAVETWPNEMLREGWEACITGDADGKERSEEIAQQCQDLELDAALYDAMTHRRAFGGGAVMMGIQDGGRPEEPVKLERVRSIDWLTPLEPRELQPLYTYANPQAPKYGRPEIWQVTPHAQGAALNYVPVQTSLIHESRLLILNGTRVSRFQTGLRTFWGDNIFTYLFSTLRDFCAAYESTGVLLNELGTPVWEVENLAQIVTSKDSSLLANRVKAMDFCKSVIRAVVIAKGEVYRRDSMSFAGVPEMMDRFGQMMAAAMDMPLTLLLGMSPGGLNATGESDLQFFYNRVKSKQKNELAPVIRRFLTLLWAGKTPKQWSVKFHPLWQESAKEKAETRKTVMDTMVAAIDAQILTPEEVRQSLYGGDEFSMEIQLDESLVAPEDFQEPPEPGAPPGAGGGGSPPGGVGSGAVKNPKARTDRKRRDYDPDQPRDENGRWGDGGRLASASGPEVQALAKMYEAQGNTEEVYGPGIKTSEAAVESMSATARAAIDNEKRAIAAGHIKVPSSKFQAFTKEIDAAAASVQSARDTVRGAQADARTAVEEMNYAADRAVSAHENSDIDDDADVDIDRDTSSETRAKLGLPEDDIDDTGDYGESAYDEVDDQLSAFARSLSGADDDSATDEPVDGDGDGKVEEEEDVDPKAAVAHYLAKAAAALSAVEKAGAAQKAALDEVKARSRALAKANAAAAREASADPTDLVAPKLYDDVAYAENRDQSEEYEMAVAAAESLMQYRSSLLDDSVPDNSEAVESLRQAAKASARMAKEIRHVLGIKQPAKAKAKRK